MAKHRGVALAELRKQRGITQVELAERMGIVQESVSRAERAENLTLDTIRRYVEALEGRLEIAAHFKGGEPVAIEIVAAEAS